MKFTTQLSEFQKLLQKIMPAIQARAAIESYESVLLTLSGNELTAIGADAEICIKSIISVNGFEDGSILMPAKKLNEIVKVLDATKELELTCQHGEYDVKLVVGKGKYSIKGRNPEDYAELPGLIDAEKPSMENLGERDIFFKKEIIQRLAEKTHFAVSTDEYRLNMSGVLFQFRESYVNAVATDSFRLVRATSFAGEALLPPNIDIVVPVRVVEILRKIDTDAVISMDTDDAKPSYLRIDFASTVIVARLINENFPKYEAIIPHTSNAEVTFDTADLLGALKRVGALASDKTRKCKLEMNAANGSMIVSAENEDLGEMANEEISAELTNADAYLVSFNISFLEQMIGNVTANDTTNSLVTMYFVTPDKATLIKPKAEQDLLAMILMPIRMV